MRVRGQRWEFQIGNNIIIVENAWSWLGYSQERVRLNDEIIKDREGWFWFILSKTEIAAFTILEEEHAVVVGISYSESDYQLYCRVITETEIHEPQSFTQAKWDTNSHKWPPDPEAFGSVD